jgi:type IV secretory pathway VirB2 component (pilin)
MRIFVMKISITFNSMFRKLYFSWVRGLQYGLFFFPLSAFADDDKISESLSNLLQMIQSKWGMLICTIAVTGIGFSSFVLGRIPMKYALSVIIGTACVVGAPRLVNLLTGV